MSSNPGAHVFEGDQTAKSQVPNSGDNTQDTMALSQPLAAWPPAGGLAAVYVSPAQTVLSVFASAKINAPAPFVFDILKNTADYPVWNTFVPRATVTKQAPAAPKDSKILINGTEFTFHVNMGDPATKKETNDAALVVSDVSTPDTPSAYVSPELLANGTFTQDLKAVYRISWKSPAGFMGTVLKAERFHEVIVRGEKECEVRTWENQSSLGAYAVKWLLEKTLNDKFALWVGDLKKFAESRFK